MARLGRRQPFKPIINGLIDGGNSPAVAAKPLVASVSVSTRASFPRAHRAFGPYIFGPVQHPAIAAQQPIQQNVSVKTANRINHRSFPPIIKDPVQFQPPIQQTIQKNASVSAANRANHRSFQPIIKGLIQYQPPAPTAPIAAKPLVLSAANENRKRSQRSFAPIFKRLGSPRPAAAAPLIISRQAIVEARRRPRLYKPTLLKLYAAPVSGPSIAQYLTADVRIGGATYVYNFPMNNLQASSAPSSTDDGSKGYAPGSIWIDKTGAHAYICISAVSSSAAWTRIDN